VYIYRSCCNVKTRVPIFLELSVYVSQLDKLLCVVANAFIEQQSLLIQGNTITVSLAPTAAGADVDTEDEAGQDEMLLRTVIVHDVSDDMEDVVSVYLENPRKNGGPIESSSYNQDTKQLSLCFASQQGVHLCSYCFIAEILVSLWTTTQNCEQFGYILECKEEFDLVFLMDSLSVIFCCLTADLSDLAGTFATFGGTSTFKSSRHQIWKLMDSDGICKYFPRISSHKLCKSACICCVIRVN